MCTRTFIDGTDFFFFVCVSGGCIYFRNESHFCRSLLKGQGIGMRIVCVTIDRKINKKLNSYQEDTSETQIGVSDDQSMKSESKLHLES